VLPTEPRSAVDPPPTTPFPAGGSRLGIPLALAIGIQNIPEEFAAGAPLIDMGASRWKRPG
jgi:zinc transporter ZupT